MPTIMWSSGDVDSGETWDDVETSARGHQFRAYLPGTFRDVLAKRALLWNETTIRTDGTAEEMFLDLAAGKLIAILDDVEGKGKI